MHAFLQLRCLLKGDVWVCDRGGTLLFSCSGVAVPPSGKDRRVRLGTARMQGGMAELAGSSAEDCFPLLFATDN